MKRRLFLLLAFIWLLAVLVIYYAGHKPFNTVQAAAAAVALGRLAAAALLVVLMGALGASVYPRPPVHPLAAAAVQVGLGWGMLSLGMLLVGSTFGLPRLLLWAAPPLLLILLRRSALDWLRKFTGLAPLWAESGAFGRAAGGLLGLSLTAPLITALAPPAAYDALVYHLTMPAAYLQAGRVLYLPWMAMTGLPQAAEMIYTLASAWGGAQTAALISWSIGPLTAAGLLGWLRARFGPRPAWAAVAALLAGYGVITALAWAYVDWLGMLFGLGALVLLDAWTQEENRAALFWAGVFAGLAFSAKYTAGNLSILLGGTLLWLCWRLKRRLLPGALVMAGGFFIPALPWLIKNLLTTGNPLYPFFFAAGAITPERVPIFQNAPPWGDWRDALLLPLRATALGFDGFSGYELSIGPLLLGLAGVCWLGLRGMSTEQRRSFQLAAAAALLAWLAWAVGNQRSGYLIQTRMYFTAFPAFAALAAAGFRGLDEACFSIRGQPVRLGRLAAALILLVLALNTAQSGIETLARGAPQAVIGIESEEEYLFHNLGFYAPAVKAVGALPAGSRTLMLLEPRSFYCRPACTPDEILDRWNRDYAATGGDPAALTAAWRAEGYTHLLVSRAGLEFLRENPDLHHSTASMTALSALLARLPAPQTFGPAYELYTLPPN